MAARSRVLTVVALAAAAAVAGTVGVTLLQTRGESTKTAPSSAAVTKPRAGAPPLVFDFGVRSDPEARALAQAATLYAKGHRAEAGRIFARYSSLEAKIGAAFAAWPKGGLDTLKQLVARHPQSGLAELHLGLAYYWSGRSADAVSAFRRTVKVEPDSPAAVSAEDILHGSSPHGLPFIVTGLSPPAAVAHLPAAQELAALARAATRPDANAKLLYGVALWNLRRPLSGERQFVAAAALAPHDPVVQTAAAVGAFSKDHPVAAFSKLGPLTGVFPRAAVVRFHLGVLLLWTGEFAKARTQLRLALAYGPRSVYASQARKVLSVLKSTGTK
ncbi:MAG TPA: tetratricopeptide repeat protein [Gaiellaceae bacterium]|nr:tetratricopeptide repeat protein [Gaiellaceae bacterium]